MILDIIPGDTIKNPSDNDIAAAVRQAYQGAVDGVNLRFEPEEDNRFMQLAGMHIEHCIGPRGPLYFAEGITLELAEQMFLDYARQGEEWKTAVSWEVLMETLPVSEPEPLAPGRHASREVSISRQGRPIASPELPVRHWNAGLVVLTAFLGVVAALALCVGLVYMVPNAKSPALLDIFIAGAILALWGIVFLGDRADRARRRGPYSPWVANVIMSLSILAVAGGLWVAVLMGGLVSLSALVWVAGGVWVVWTSIRQMIAAQQFEVSSIEAEATHLNIVAISVYGGGKRRLLEYTYLETYGGTRDVSWQDRRLKKAMKEGRLRVFVRYLPDNPEVHRASHIEVG